MSEENENQPAPEEEQPETAEESSDSGEEVSAEDIVGDDAEMTPEEAETLAAAMAAINQVEGGEPAEKQAEKPAEPEMSADEAETLAAAMAAINQVQGVADSAAPAAPAPSPADNAQSFSAPVFGEHDPDSPKEGMDLLSDVHMDVRIELGRSNMFVEDVLKLGDGAVVELDKLAGDPVDVFVNNRKVARGEVLVLNDMFCVRISEIVDISTADV
ncbi:MAG: flagellar motor switch protein FliN [Phycisphaerales bacterium]